MARGRRIEVEILGDSRSLERAFARSSRSGKRFNRDLSQAGRGVVAVSGLFSGLGRQVAFASGAFLGGAGFTKVLRDSIGEAADAVKTQKQLAAQFRANNQDLRLYQAQIDATSTRLSRLAGIQDEELTQAFTNAFRGTKNVAAALKVEAVAADVARGRNVELSAAGIALTKAYLGQTTALKRLGIQIPANVKGMEALELVGRRFAGQAAAGTTAQQRLSVAIAETEETIGKVLLPTVTKITKSITDWLNKEENQKRIQQDVEKGVRVLSEAFKGFNTVLQTSVDLVNKFNTALDKIPGGDKGLIDLIKGADLGSGSGNRALTDALNTALKAQTATGTADRQPGRGPRGPGGPAEAAAAEVKARQESAAKVRRSLSLVGKIARAELSVAKALTTQTKADDRAALVVLKQLIEEAIASHKKAFKDKTKLYQQDAAIQDQIQAIDDAAAQKRIDAQEKAAAKAKRAREKERAARKKAQDILKRAAKEAIEAAKQQTREFRDLIQTERDRIGELFTGPVFNPSEAQRKAALGAPTPGANVKALVADLKAQIQQFKAFQRDLATLAKRGAPPQLLAELRQGGLAVAPQVHALASSGAGDFSKFKGLFIQRERLAVETAKQERPIINLTVIVNRDTGHVSVKTTPHGQKRGRNPGVPVGTSFLVTR